MLCAGFPGRRAGIDGGQAERRPKAVSRAVRAAARISRRGGVAANQAIRGALQQVAATSADHADHPAAGVCTDNGAMIAWAGAERLAIGLTDAMDAAPPRARWLLDANATAPAGFSNTRAGY